MAEITAAERVTLARHAGRPGTADYISALFTDFFPCKGDRQCREDPAILEGLALPVADDGDRLSVKAGDGSEDAGIFPAQPVSLTDKDVGKQVVDEVHGAGAARHTSDLHPLGGS